MAVFMISYDIKVQENFEYPNLYEAIKSIGSWCHPLESVWYVDTLRMSAGDISRYLKPFLTTREFDGDYFIVQRCHWDKDGWCLTEAKQWLNDPLRSWSIPAL